MNEQWEKTLTDLLNQGEAIKQTIKILDVAIPSIEANAHLTLYINVKGHNLPVPNTDTVRTALLDALKRRSISSRLPTKNLASPYSALPFLGHRQ